MPPDGFRSLARYDGGEGLRRGLLHIQELPK